MVEDKDMHPREDDRNDEVDESPVPDPTEKKTGSDDDHGTPVSAGPAGRHAAPDPDAA